MKVVCIEDTAKNLDPKEVSEFLSKEHKFTHVMILEFLNTPPGKSLKAWDKWEKYWANLDYPARRKKLLD